MKSARDGAIPGGAGGVVAILLVHLGLEPWEAVIVGLFAAGSAAKIYRLLRARIKWLAELDPPSVEHVVTVERH